MMRLFPSSPLTMLLRSYFMYMSISPKEKEDDDSDSDREQTTKPSEDAYDALLVSQGWFSRF
jgi:hypothetical protein